MHSLPGAHAWVCGFANNKNGDPGKAADEPIPPNRSVSKWCSSKQNRGFHGSSIRRGNAVDEMLSDSSTALHAVFKKEIEKHGLVIDSWQRCIEVPPSAPAIFQGHAPILDCLCVERKKNGGIGNFVPVEVKACRPRKLKRRTAKDVGFKKPFDKYADTYGLRHQLQLCVQNVSLGSKKPRGFVAYVNVHDLTVTMIKLNKDLWELAHRPSD